MKSETRRRTLQRTLPLLSLTLLAATAKKSASAAATTTNSMLLSFATPTTPSSNVFHSGEDSVQRRVGVQQEVASWAPHAVLPYLSRDHQHFYQAQPFVVIAARDRWGQMWSSLLFPTNKDEPVVTSPDHQTLNFASLPLSPHDALCGALEDGSDIGILAMEFATKSRIRANGRVLLPNVNDQQNQDSHHDKPSWTSNTNTPFFQVKVDQSYGNCPQYIKPRRWFWSQKSRTIAQQQTRSNNENATTTPDTICSAELSPRQMRIIDQKVETIFLATGYRDAHSSASSSLSSQGCDASHRGGRPGWIHVKSPTILQMPDYAGNNMFQTLGNLEMDDRMGIVIPAFELAESMGAGMMQLTGRAQVLEWNATRAAQRFGPAAKRIVQFTIAQVLEQPIKSPLQWESIDLQDASKPRPLQVTERIVECRDVVSLTLKPTAGDDPRLWDFRPGQHLPITLYLPAAEDDDKDEDAPQRLFPVDRTYSLSCGRRWGEYRISVKKRGVASDYLAEKVQVGDLITCRRPAGTFVLNKDALTNRTRATVLLSAGIGVTPLISMLHEFLQGVFSSPFDRSAHQPCYFIHGTRNDQHWAFSSEMKRLSAVGKEAIQTHVAFSDPRTPEDSGLYDSVGRVDPSLVAQVIGTQVINKATFYICGPRSFVVHMKEGLQQKYGVDPQYLLSEEF